VIFMKRKGSQITHAERISSVRRAEENERGGYKRPEKIGLNGLLRSYLCQSRLSDCVIKGKCANLDKCRYGQRYIKLTKGREG
jgi:hypothetical protein